MIPHHVMSQQLLMHGLLRHRVALALVVVSLISRPAWLPVAVTRLAPGAGRRVLASVGDLIAGRGRAAVLVVLCAGGVFSGVVGLVA